MPVMIDRRDALVMLAASVAPAEDDRQGDPRIRAALERYATAWLANDLPAIVACYHDRFTLHYFGANPLSGVHVGKRAALATLAEFGRLTGRQLLGVIDVMAGASRGAILARERLGKGGDARDVYRVLVYRIEDGLLAECWVHEADQALIDRLLTSPAGAPSAI